MHITGSNVQRRQRIDLRGAHVIDKRGLAANANAHAIQLRGQNSVDHCLAPGIGGRGQTCAPDVQPGAGSDGRLKARGVLHARNGRISAAAGSRRQRIAGAIDVVPKEAAVAVGGIARDINHDVAGIAGWWCPVEFECGRAGLPGPRTFEAVLDIFERSIRRTGQY